MPNLEGDPKYSKRGPDFEQRRDLKGTKKGTQDSSCSTTTKKSLHVETFRKLNLDEEKTLFLFLLSFKQTDINPNINS